jgi:phytoene/squalene synthetase
MGQYDPCDIYNMDKADLFRKATPDCMLAIEATPRVKIEKVRVTLTVCRNADETDKASILLSS